MPEEIRMPKLADTLVEGTVARWLKAAGETVQAGEAIAEIETDKVTTELTAPQAGTLGDLLVAEGETVAIGTPIVRILSQGEPASHSVGSDAQKVHDEQPTQETKETDKTEPTAKRASPVAMRLAQEHGVDLRRVDIPGSRIRRADVERHLGQPPGDAKQSAISLVAGSVSAIPNKIVQPGESFPLKGMRKTTAARMALARQIPTGCAVVQADASALERYIQREREAWLASEGFALTYTPFFLHALAHSLRAWPLVRQAIRDGRVEPREDVHVGVAVALDDGLIVPVIRHADRYDLAELARAQADLVIRARTRRLQAGEVSGGIASLTNVGSMGGLLAMPMLNEDQAVILGVGAVTRRAVGDANGVRYRPCAYLSLTFDRRLLDDLQAERFLLDVAQRIEQFTPFGPLS